MLMESHSEAIAMSMICTLLQHGFLLVVLKVGKIELYSNSIYQCAGVPIQRSANPGGGGGGEGT